MSAYINNFYGTYIEHIDTYIQHQDNAPQQAEPIAQIQRRQTTQDVLETPREGKYTEVRRYIEERKRFDEEFKTFCVNHSLRDLCTRLTNEFGWFVDENSLQRNINRNR
jgi:hypothetical protein